MLQSIDNFTGNPTTVLVSGVILLLLLDFTRRGLFSSKASIPPGPRGYPIIGNLFDVPKVRPQEVYAEWAKKYGDLVYLNVLGTGILVLNSQEAAIDLLDKRGVSYQNRPKLVFAGEIVGFSRGLALRQGDSRHREMRRHFSVEIGSHKVDRFASLEEKESTRYLKKLLIDPEGFRNHIRWVVGNIIMLIGYGYSVQEKNDPFIDVVERAMENFSIASAPGVWIVDSLPFLKYVPSWFPGFTFQKVGKEYRSLLYKANGEPLDMVKREMSEGTAIPSVASRMLETHSATTEDELDCIRFTLGSFYGGGADTSVSSISTFFLAMSMNPAIMRRAQQEIDNIALIDGGGRLPNLADKEQLPYIVALVKEVLRWGPVVPLGIPHCAVEEDVYNGYRIPKGTIVLSNIWAIMNDPKCYPNPETFNPERFLGPVEKQQPDPRSTAFGYGRRVCPGSALAEQTIFIIIARTLAVFDIHANGEPPPRPWMEGKVIQHPVSFKCTVTPRSPQHAALIGQAMA